MLSRLTEDEVESRKSKVKCYDFVDEFVMNYKKVELLS